MRHRDILRANRPFMLALMALAIVVLMVVALFWYWCLPVR